MSGDPVLLFGEGLLAALAPSKSVLCPLHAERTQHGAGQDRKRQNPSLLASPMRKQTNEWLRV